MSSAQFDGWMRWGRRIAGLCGLAILGLTQMGAGCGAGLDAESSQDACMFDSDCIAGQACSGGFCVTTCTNDDDCFPGEVCSVVPSGETTLQTCVIEEPQENNSNAECQIDSDCQDPRALCSVDGYCFVPEAVTGLLIQDVSPATALELPEDGVPGADVAAVYLVDGAGEPVAFGETIVARGADSQRIVSALSGQPPALTEDGSCIEGPITSTTSLGGEGGFMLVRFVDVAGEPVMTPPADWRVVVIEWSDNCDETIQEPQERLVVRGCEANNFDAIDFDLDCQTNFGEPFFGKATLDPS